MEALMLILKTTIFKGYITRVKVLQVLQQRCLVELSVVMEILYMGSNTVAASHQWLDVKHLKCE